MKVKDARKGWATTNGHLFSFFINIYFIRYQEKSTLLNYGKCLENEIVKQEPEH